MKIKQFFIDNKSKIKEILENIFHILLFLFVVFCVYSSGFIYGAYFERTEESNKKELVNRRQRVNSSDITYINLLTDEVIDSDVHAYYNANGSLVNSSALTLTNKFRVNSSVSYVYGNLTGQVAYVSFFDSNDNFISSITYSGLLSSPSNAYYCALSVFNARLNDSYFYQGQIVYNYYLPPIQNILDDEYNEGYDFGYLEGQPKNIFYYDVQKDSPILLVFDDISFIRPDDYDENLLFKNNYLDLQYLRSLYFNEYSKFRIIFTDSIYSLKDLYLSLDNSSLIDYNILVNGKAYSINSSGTLNIPSSELLQAMEFDSSLLDSTRLINASPDFANGFNSGYENGYENGYDEGVSEEESHYEELIIPAVKLEYEEIGYNKGYLAGKNDTLNEGSGVALLDAFTLIGKGFEVWNPILNTQVLPGLTIGVFIAIPIVIGVVMIVIKLLQR